MLGNILLASNLFLSCKPPATSNSSARLEYCDAIAVTQDGKTLVAAGRDIITTTTIETAKLSRTIGLDDEHFFFTCVSVSPDGKMVATGGHRALSDAFTEFGEVKLWQLPEINNGRTLARYPDFISSVLFSPDGKQLAIACGDTIDLWETSTWKKSRVLNDTHEISALAFAHDGSRLASANKRGMIKIWRFPKGDVAQTFTQSPNPLGPDYWIRSLAFTPDGRQLASAAHEGVFIWDFGTAKVAKRFLGDYDTPSFSPDGKVLAVGGNGKIHLLDTETGGELRTHSIIPKGRCLAAFTSDGKFLASAGYDGTTLFFRSSE